jgi:hypothetical protein
MPRDNSVSPVNQRANRQYLPAVVAIVLGDSFEILRDEIFEDWKSVGRGNRADMTLLK